MNSTAPRYTAFVATRRVAAGPPAQVAIAAKREIESDTGVTVLVFDDETGQPVDFDLRGSDAEVVARLAAPPSAPVPAEGEPPRGRGRPKLGVVAREVTLLPRHWEWLSAQPGGASVALRKLVEAARSSRRGPDGVRRAQEAAGRIMTALAGDFAGYEDASRALYAKDRMRFEALIEAWPADVREHVLKLAAGAFDSPPST